MFQILNKAFIAPVRDQKLSSLYAALVTGVLGFSFIDLFIVLSLVSFGLETLIIYFALRFFLANILFHPIITISHNSAGFYKTVIGFILLQAIILIAFSIHNAPLLNPYYAAIFLAFAFTPYWHFYHLVMTHKTSDHNRGNEVSIANILTSLAAIGGNIIAGAFSDFNHDTPGQWTGTVIIILGSVMMGIMLLMVTKDKANAGTSPSQSIQVISRRLAQSLMRTFSTILFGAHQALTGFLLPVWLFLIGFSGIETGIILAGTIILNIILSPLLGYLINRNKVEDIRIGCLFKIMGWIPWLFIVEPFVFVWSLIFWSMGGHFHDTGVVSRWYAQRYNEDIAGREFCLGIGRIFASIAGAFLLFKFIGHYPAFGLSISILALAASYLPDDKTLQMHKNQL